MPKVPSETESIKEFEPCVRDGENSVKHLKTLLFESSDTRLGPRGRRFETCHSDQFQGKTANYGGFSALDVRNF